MGKLIVLGLEESTSEQTPWMQNGGYESCDFPWMSKFHSEFYVSSFRKLFQSSAHYTKYPIYLLDDIV